ncbi:hypothetical protein HMN09_00041300 [Mycena chlorophos]|uniref:Uncharacterized protein n=1 Tax=Mycena chlorophos TaxID=658473 RepID=A0A8H6TRF3_MYCCL|nr:hypothetical protein HMN09_00041300 [Mycena chlorophos]
MHHHEGPVPDGPPPATTATILDRLEEISLKGFPIVGTPTSATMSLPTPECQPIALPNDATMQNPPDLPVSYFIATDDAAIVVPGAPLMKELDSFTEGSREGSFASLPPAEVNEWGAPIYPISEGALAALPLYNSNQAIHEWRLDVPSLVFRDAETTVVTPSSSSSSTTEVTPTNAKRPRPRSSSSDDEADGDRRNRRPRAGTPPAPSHRIRAQSFGTSGSSGVQRSFLWVDRGPPPNDFPRPRPPSRANSAPPD